MAHEKNAVNVKMLGAFSVGYNKKKVSENVMLVENTSWQLIKYLLVNSGRTVTMDELKKKLSFSGRIDNIENTIRVRLRRSRQILEAVGLGSPRDGLILYANDQFWINPVFIIKSDVQKIDSCYMSVVAMGAQNGGGLSECVEGLTCYTGKYMENSRPSGWVIKAREYYSNVYIELWKRCIELMRATGDYSKAAAVWQNTLKMMPQQTELHIKFLKGLLEQGLVAEAATYYSKLAIVLSNTEQQPPDFNSLMA